MGKLSFITFAAFLLLAVNHVSSVALVNGKIKITTVTASGCGDTVNFITNQLVPAYQLYKDFLEIEFVPWGRTVWNADDTFTCQFGNADCWANRLHRCSLDLLKGQQDRQVEYMACEFRPPHPAFLQGSYSCALANGLSVSALDNCMRGHADEIDRDAHSKAAEPMRIINFVPAIVFNDNIDVLEHTIARISLYTLLCSAIQADPSTGVERC